MSSNKKKQRIYGKNYSRDDSPEENALRTASIIDDIVETLAKRAVFMTGDLYRLHPDAKQQICGCLGNEGLIETILRRFDEFRCNGPNAPDAPSLEAAVREAITAHPLRTQR